MGKHFFHESNTNNLAQEDRRFYKIIFCEWCGLVAWHFNKTDISMKELQKQVGDECKANKENK